MGKNIILNGISAEEFTSGLMTKIEERFKTLENKLNPQTILLTRKETAKKLGVDPSTIFNWSKKGILKPHQLGGRIYYKLSDIENSLTEIKTF